jgi:hypothetical protein
MEPNYHYATVSEAIDHLKKQGYTIDFNLKENCIYCEGGKFQHDEFEIAETYRYEGDSDPGDEATVYAIESKTGIKGVLVTGYGMYADSNSAEILKKLRLHQLGGH